MFHNILHPALEDIAEPVNGIHLHIEIVAEAVKLGTVYIVFRVEIILGDILLTHGLP